MPAEEVAFEEGEIYAIDIVMSTGEGKGVEGEAKTSMFFFPPPYFHSFGLLILISSYLQACSREHLFLEDEGLSFSSQRG